MGALMAVSYDEDAANAVLLHQLGNALHRFIRGDAHQFGGHDVAGLGAMRLGKALANGFASLKCCRNQARARATGRPGGGSGHLRCRSRAAQLPHPPPVRPRCRGRQATRQAPSPACPAVPRPGRSSSGLRRHGRFLVSTPPASGTVGSKARRGMRGGCGRKQGHASGCRLTPNAAGPCHDAHRAALPSLLQINAPGRRTVVCCGNIFSAMTRLRFVRVATDKPPAAQSPRRARLPAKPLP